MKRPDVNAAINYAAGPVREEVFYLNSLHNFMSLPAQGILSTITLSKIFFPVISLKSVHKTLWTVGHNCVRISISNRSPNNKYFYSA